MDVYNCYFYDGNNPFNIGITSNGVPVSAAGGQTLTTLSSGYVLTQSDLNCDSCLPRRPADPSPPLQAYVSTQHRKLALYLGLQDLVDGNGHGSHVAGEKFTLKYAVNTITRLHFGLLPPLHIE